MYDNHSGGVIDFDDLDLPDPEGESGEDVSEEPTVAAPTDALLAAVTARYETMNSIGELELELEPDNAEPTLATPPLVPAAPPTMTARPLPTPATPTAPAPALPAPAAFPVITVLVACAIALGLILGATWMALGAS